jgi:hypothetical protein
VQHIPNRSPNCLHLKTEKDFEKLLVRGVLCHSQKSAGNFGRQRFAVGRNEKAPPAPSKALCAARAIESRASITPPPNEIFVKAAVVPRSCLLKTTSLPRRHPFLQPDRNHFFPWCPQPQKVRALPPTRSLVLGDLISNLYKKPLLRFAKLTWGDQSRFPPLHA